MYTFFCFVGHLLLLLPLSAREGTGDDADIPMCVFHRFPVYIDFYEYMNYYNYISPSWSIIIVLGVSLNNFLDTLIHSEAPL